MIKNLLLVGLGGGLGSMARYGCQRWLGSQYPHPFPWGTFAVNISGCFLIGLIWGMSLKNAWTHEDSRLFLMTGICGGFTTFSAFTLESIGLIKEQRWILFFVYVAASVLLGLLATFAGIRLGR